MKNIRLFFSALCVVSLGVFNTAKADDVKAPGNVKFKIESKTITKEQAASLVASGEKVTLSVYLVLDAGWKSQLDAGNVQMMSNQMSFAFFENETYSSGNFLQNPADHIAICAQNYTETTPSGGCGGATTSSFGMWYASVVRWYNPAAYGWPYYAYGCGFEGGGTLPPSNGDQSLFRYFQIVDGNYQYKLFDIQFVLKDATRSYPVGILDDGIKIDAALGATEVSIADQNSNAYRPQGPDGKLIIATDWTTIPEPYFQFVNGGLFIENGPEAETFEPYFLS